MDMQHCSGVDFVLSTKEAPFCPHGPTLLFERFYKDQPPRKYFACSVYRDRKQCSFFMWADTKITDERRKRWKQIFDANQPKICHKDLMSKLETCKKLKYHKDLKYCTSCSTLVLPSELSDHKTHEDVCTISFHDIFHPSKFIPAITSRKGEAQYFFTDDCTEFLLSSLEDEGFTTVLCVGTPRSYLWAASFRDSYNWRAENYTDPFAVAVMKPDDNAKTLHEAIITSHHANIKSFLLDIDYRYAQFFGPESYQQYNLFTSFFYDTSNGQRYCEQFLHTEKQHNKIAIIIDPPFGGMTDVIANGMRQLWAMTGKEVTTFLIFPYFLESHVLKSLPNFYMLDYEVSYENHHYFKRAKPRPSFVKIFTNMPLPGLKLPLNQGYSLCTICNRYVCNNNVHCDQCGVCPSKDGKRYLHCHQCQRCVKGGYVHCDACSLCLPVNHVCHSVTVRGCHICGSTGHKRRDCPRKNVIKDFHESNTNCDRESRGRKRKWHRISLSMKRRKLLDFFNQGVY